MSNPDEFAEQVARSAEVFGMPDRVTGYVFARADDEPSKSEGPVEDVGQAWVEAGAWL